MDRETLNVMRDGGRGVIERGGQSSGFLIVIFFLISPAADGIMIKNKIKIKNQKLTARAKLSATCLVKSQTSQRKE